MSKIGHEENQYASVKTTLDSASNLLSSSKSIGKSLRKSGTLATSTEKIDDEETAANPLAKSQHELNASTNIIGSNDRLSSKNTKKSNKSLYKSNGKIKNSSPNITSAIPNENSENIDQSVENVGSINELGSSKQVSASKKALKKSKEKLKSGHAGGDTHSNLVSTSSLKISAADLPPDSTVEDAEMGSAAKISDSLSSSAAGLTKDPSFYKSGAMKKTMGSQTLGSFSEGEEETDAQDKEKAAYASNGSIKNTNDKTIGSNASISASKKSSLSKLKSQKSASAEENEEQAVGMIKVPSKASMTSNKLIENGGSMLINSELKQNLDESDSIRPSVFDENAEKPEDSILVDVSNSEQLPLLIDKQEELKGAENGISKQSSTAETKSEYPEFFSQVDLTADQSKQVSRFPEFETEQQLVDQIPIAQADSIYSVFKPATSSKTPKDQSEIFVDNISVQISNISASQLKDDNSPSNQVSSISLSEPASKVSISNNVLSKGETQQASNDLPIDFQGEPILSKQTSIASNKVLSIQTSNVSDKGLSNQNSEINGKISTLPSNVSSNFLSKQFSETQPTLSKQPSQISNQPSIILSIPIESLRNTIVAESDNQLSKLPSTIKVSKKSNLIQASKTASDGMLHPKKANNKPFSADQTASIQKSPVLISVSAPTSTTTIKIAEAPVEPTAQVDHLENELPQEVTGLSKQNSAYATCVEQTVVDPAISDQEIPVQMGEAETDKIPQQITVDSDLNNGENSDTIWVKCFIDQEVPRVLTIKKDMYIRAVKDKIENEINKNRAIKSDFDIFYIDMEGEPQKMYTQESLEVARSLYDELKRPFMSVICKVSKPQVNTGKQSEPNVTYSLIDDSYRLRENNKEFSVHHMTNEIQFNKADWEKLKDRYINKNSKFREVSHERVVERQQKKGYYNYPTQAPKFKKNVAYKNTKHWDYSPKLKNQNEYTPSIFTEHKPLPPKHVRTPSYDGYFNADRNATFVKRSHYQAHPKKNYDDDIFRDFMQIKSKFQQGKLKEISDDLEINAPFRRRGRATSEGGYTSQGNIYVNQETINETASSSDNERVINNRNRASLTSQIPEITSQEYTKKMVNKQRASEEEAKENREKEGANQRLRDEKKVEDEKIRTKSENTRIYFEDVRRQDDYNERHSRKQDDYSPRAARGRSLDEDADHNSERWRERRGQRSVSPTFNSNRKILSSIAKLKLKKLYTEALEVLDREERQKKKKPFVVHTAKIPSRLDDLLKEKIELQTYYDFLVSTGKELPSNVNSKIPAPSLTKNNNTKYSKNSNFGKVDHATSTTNLFAEGTTNTSTINNAPVIPPINTRNHDIQTQQQPAIIQQHIPYNVIPSIGSSPMNTSFHNPSLHPMMVQTFPQSYGPQNYGPSMWDQQQQQQTPHHGYIVEVQPDQELDQGYLQRYLSNQNTGILLQNQQLPQPVQRWQMPPPPIYQNPYPHFSQAMSSPFSGFNSQYSLPASMPYFPQQVPQYYPMGNDLLNYGPDYARKNIPKPSSKVSSIKNKNAMVNLNNF